jgi:hypothetical protein
MFGIDLGQLRKSPSTTEHYEADSEPLNESAWEAVSDPVDATAEGKYDDEGVSSENTLDAGEADPRQIESSNAAEEGVVVTDEEAPVDESLDPVAAYMEQLLARTRKSAAKSPPPPPKPVPPPIAPVVPVAAAGEHMEPEPEPIAEVKVKTPKPARKHEQVDKNALRANLDSFRSIANNQARSAVARSEGRRLVIIAQAKQIFLVSSIVITVVLLSTEFWTERKYRLEILAGIIATTFLGFDYYRTQQRLRELGLLAGNDADSQDEDGDEGLE